MISHRNLRVNFEQLMRGFFADFQVKVPSDLTIVSWLPFYHDMGLVLGVCAPILGGYRGDDAGKKHLGAQTAPAGGDARPPLGRQSPGRLWLRSSRSAGDV